MSENMNKHGRNLLSLLAVSGLVLSIVAVVAFGEWRMRNYVGRPWTEERPDVLRTLEDIQSRAEQGVEERKVLVDKLEAIDNRVQQFERRMVVILRDERPPILDPPNGSQTQPK